MPPRKDEGRSCCPPLLSQFAVEMEYLVTFSAKDSQISRTLGPAPRIGAVVDMQLAFGCANLAPELSACERTTTPDSPFLRAEKFGIWHPAQRFLPRRLLPPFLCLLAPFPIALFVFNLAARLAAWLASIRPAIWIENRDGPCPRLDQRSRPAVGAWNIHLRFAGAAVEVRLASSLTETGMEVIETGCRRPVEARQFRTIDRRGMTDVGVGVLESHAAAPSALEARALMLASNNSSGVASVSVIRSGQ